MDMKTKTKVVKDLPNDIENFLRETITALEPEPMSKKAGRPRILPALALWAGLLTCITQGINSQRGIWQLLSVKGLWHFPRFTLSDQAIYKRLDQAPRTTIQSIFEQITMILNLRLKDIDQTQHFRQLAAFASGVFSIDGMTLDKISKRLPSLQTEIGTVLGGKLSAIFDVNRQLWRSITFHEDSLQNDKLEVREVIKGLPVGSLLLFDLGFFAFSWFDYLHDSGYWFVSRFREKTSYTVIQTLFDQNGVADSIIWLGAYRADKAAHALRLVEVLHKGVSRRYLTNVLDPKVLSVVQVLQLYGRRWDIEMMFNLVKTYLGLHFLMSSKVNVMLHQVFAVFSVAQVILGLRSELALRAKVDVFEVSLSLFVRWVVRLAADGDDPIAILVERGRFAGIIRPSSRVKFELPLLDDSLYDVLKTNTILIRVPRYARKA
jgi:IS4 transposase